MKRILTINRTGCRLGISGAIGTILGIVVSGPLAVGLVEATHPQPPWNGPALFARSFHPIQIVPYAGGILLVAGLVLLIASSHAIADDSQRPLANAALVFSAVFATLVFMNYIVQTTFVPGLVNGYVEPSAPILAALSMANPKSLAWAFEMWGWGFLGVATWLVARVFSSTRLERAAGRALAANGPISIGGGVWTAVQPGWMMTRAGLVAFALWNVLLFAMAVLVLIALRRRLRADGEAGKLCPAEASGPWQTREARSSR